MHNTYKKYGALAPEELLLVCNKVRESGGGRELSRLSPGTSHEAGSCLIATNLNFNCHVDLYYKFFDENAGEWIVDPNDLEKLWCMVALDHEVMEKIHKEMGWKIGYAFRLNHVNSKGDPSDIGGERSLLLPQRMANSAEAFDEGAYDSSLYC